MIGLFGDPVRLERDEAVVTPAVASMERVRQGLEALKDQGSGFLCIYRTSPAAVFSPRDTTHERYVEATAAMRSLGFEPLERLAGGHLAVFDQNSLIIDLVAHHTDPREHMITRFEAFSDILVSAFKALGLDARVGEIPGEYCPGRFSVNGEGRIKLAGLAQRVTRHGYHLGAVIPVFPSDDALEATSRAYELLGLRFDPATFGSLADFAPAISIENVHSAILEALMARSGLLVG